MKLPVFRVGADPKKKCPLYLSAGIGDYPTRSKYATGLIRCVCQLDDRFTTVIPVAVLLILSLVAECNVVVQAAQTSGLTPPSTPSPSAQRAVRKVVGSDTTKGNPDDELSADADEVAILTEILPLYERLKTEQQAAHTTTTDNIRQNQRIIYLHAKVNQYLHSASLEVASVSGRLNAGMAQLADRKAIISDQRAQLLRKNTTINLISGGLTKIGGYSTALVPNVSAIPTNVLEVFDGTVQVGLSAVNMKAQSAERDFYKSKPAILHAFLSNANDENGFPKSVWLYLTTPTSTGKTRREMLIAQWRASGRLTGRRRSQPGAASMKMDDLDDMVAMMSDIKSVVAGMEVSLMKLSEVLKESYQHDPEI